MLTDLLASGEMAPGDLVAWHDYFDDHVTKAGMALMLRPGHALVLWDDGTVESYGPTLDALFGTSIRVRRQMPLEGEWRRS